METRLNFENGKIRIECDSNSIAGFMGIAQMALDQAEKQTDKVDRNKLGDDDQAALDAIQERSQELSEAMFDFDNWLMNVPSESELKFYYEDTP